MKKVALFLISAMMIGTTAVAQVERGPDGYAFDQKQQERNQFRVKVVIYKNHADLVIASKRWGMPIGNNINGFSITVNGVCEIHIHDPNYSYEPEIAGHELFHCMYGKWHKQ